MTDGPEIQRKRAEHAAMLAEKALPAGIESKRLMLLRWNGEAPAPQFTHWTNRGTFSIRAHTPGKCSEVLFNGRHLGFGDNQWLQSVAKQLYNGAYDRELGFRASDLIPPTLKEWNEMGG